MRLWVVALALLAWSGASRAQDLPGLPTPPKVETPRAATGVVPDPTDDNPEATVAEAAGPIAVRGVVDDEPIRGKLQRLLPQYPGVRSIEVEVEDGVVTLTGHVADDEVRDRLRDFVRRVEGVTLVLNRTRTDAQVLTAGELARKRLSAFWQTLRQKWLVLLGGLGVLGLSLALSRLTWRWAEVVLALVMDNVLLRSVLGSLLGGLVLITGFVGALWVWGVADTVIPGLGLAGVMALAVSFAFRDITENFISSILLGARRPFRVGDYVTIGNHAGVVKALNTRATILVTLDGHQVRIPNATVFKAVMIIHTASTSVRGGFDVLIPYEASTTAAQAAIAAALRSHDGILPEPPARALVEALEPGGVRLRAIFWYPARGIDNLKLLSDARLRVKVALQDQGITPPPTGLALTISGPLSVNLDGSAGGPEADRPGIARPDAARDGVSGMSEQARDNLRRDAQAAASASATSPDAQDHELEHALEIADDEVSAEGENLLPKADDVPPRPTPTRGS